MNNRFSENLKKIRKENNLSQEQLADELGVSRQAISKWESAVAYPEMDKIIALCDKFNLNIDDLLHKDIKEVKGEEESKKKLNSVIDDFLNFITNTINLFSSMNFRSKINCLCEQIVIAFILLLLSAGIYHILERVFENILRFLPNKFYFFIINFIDSILMIGLLIICIIVITHIFKTRYLDYYEKIKKESKTDEDIEESKNEEKNNKISFKEENKIIIRDPKHSEYKFLNTLFKIIILVIKFFTLFASLFIAMLLISFVILFIISFLLYKTGFFFIGLLITILSSTVITIVILLLLLNFVFNRKNDKKKMIWSFIVSLITFGMGCGLIFIGTLSFERVENKDSYLNVITKEYEMKDDLRIYPYRSDIVYVESDNSNIKIEYSVNKYCSINDYYNEESNYIEAWSNCERPMEIVKDIIKNANDKKIIPINDSIENITVYTSRKNIEKLKNNWTKYFDYIKEKEIEEAILRESYEKRISELIEENSTLSHKLEELQYELNGLKSEN